MPDVVDPATRSRMMAGIRSKNTAPEMILRRGLHRRGLRYRLHARDLPGSPDLVFPARSAVLFAHGCFWHGHDCHLFRVPKTRPEFWTAKIERNRALDDRAEAELKAAGWRVGRVWECAIRGRTRLDQEFVLGSLENWVRNGSGDLNLVGSTGS